MSNKVSVALVVIAVLGFVALCAENRSLASNQRATLKLLAEQQATTRRWQAKYATAAAHVERDVDTVKVRVASYRTIRDTLRLTDTVMVKVALERADSTINACTELVTSCERLRVASDSAQHSLTVERDYWRKVFESEARKNKLHQWLAPIAFMGGAVLGAFVRGQ